MRSGINIGLILGFINWEISVNFVLSSAACTKPCCNIPDQMAPTHVCRLKFRIQFKVLAFIFWALDGETSIFIRTLVALYHQQDSQFFWPESCCRQCRLKANDDRASEVVTPTLWKSLPSNLWYVSLVEFSLHFYCFFSIFCHFLILCLLFCWFYLL